MVQEQPKPVERQETKKEEIQEPEPVMKEIVRDTPSIIEPVATAQPYAAPVATASQPAVEDNAASSAMTNALSAAVADVESVTASAAPAAPEPPPVVASAPIPRTATKADYAWLAESLGRRIATLTRYPSTARLNGWEGRVVLRAVIRSDGHLLEVTVHRSSGHDALDRAALETIKLACPLHMKHALNTAEVAVYVPIVYSLSG
jgi:protein TonB